MALGFMRRHRKWLYVFLWLIIAAFIILYIPVADQSPQGSAGEVVARVGDLTITAGEFRLAYFRQRRMLESQFADQLTPELLASLALEQRTLDYLVADKLIQLEARRIGLEVDDAAVARALQTTPEFQRNGSFIGAAEIRRLLDLQNMSVADFEDSLRQQLLADRLRALVTDGVSVTDSELEVEYRRRSERVKAEYVLVPATRFEESISVSDTDVESAFAADPERWKRPEGRRVSYLLLDSEALRADAVVSDADAVRYYDSHRSEFRTEEQVCARHVLIKTASGGPGAEGHPEPEARALAAEVRSSLLAGVDFASVAIERSEDRGSAPRGGDLGCFPRGRMVPAFDEAVFSLPVGEVSEPVQTPFGIHLIEVTSRTDSGTQPIDAVRERIDRVLTDRQVQRTLRENMAKIEEGLSEGRSLETLAAEVGASVSQSERLELGRPVPPLDSTAALSRVFLLAEAETASEPFAVSQGVVFVRLDAIEPPSLPELDSVREQVKADLAEDARFEAALSLAQTLRADALQRGLERAADTHDLSREELDSGRGQGLGGLRGDAALDEAVFGLAPEELSEPLRTDSGFVVLRVLEKDGFDAQMFEEQRAGIRSAMLQQRRAELFQAYMTEARERFEVRRDDDVLERILG